MSMERWKRCCLLILVWLALGLLYLSARWCICQGWRRRTEVPKCRSGSLAITVPVVSLVADGVDVSGTINAVLKFLSLGAEVIYDRGSFVVDKVAASGPPHAIDITAHVIAAGGSSLRASHERAWTQSAVSKVVADVAAGLDFFVSGDAKPMAIGYAAQERETDAAFLTRFSRLYGLSFKVAAGVLRVSKIGSELASGGKAKTIHVVNWSEVKTYTLAKSEQKSRYKSVTATCWMNRLAGYKTVRAGEGEPSLALAKNFNNDPESALAACKSRLLDFQRSGSEGSVDLAVPRLDVYAGNLLRFIGAPALFDGVHSVAGCTHSLPSPFVFKIQLKAFVPSS